MRKSHNCARLREITGAVIGGATQSLLYVTYQSVSVSAASVTSLHQLTPTCQFLILFPFFHPLDLRTYM